ncbi:hypothetical protein [Acrocarpospora sp. B8E8]|uniref:hypothetical protein n=1 Tax=Acrocarpospora sp. B8E8 TaxID=3153572 RepID=UPI00325DE2D8
MATVRELIEILKVITADLPTGLDTEVEVGLCDGDWMTMTDAVDIDYFARVPMDGGSQKQLVLLRAHLHPGQGRRVRGVGAEVEDDLRKLTSDPDEGFGA